MNRRGFLEVAIAGAIAPALWRDGSLRDPAGEPGAAPHHTAGLETVGLYVSLPTDPPPKNPAVYDYFRACGYNYLEFCEAGFRYRPPLHPEYYQEISRAIALAHAKGFRVGIVLLGGMEQWNGRDSTGFAGPFSPLDTVKLQDRLAYLRRAVRALHDADVFVFLPGDPGGDPGGRSTLSDCISFCRQIQQIVAESAPAAEFVLNLWAVAEWEGFPSPFSLRFWEQEVALSRRLTAESGLLGPGRGVAFPLHNYYRSLALASYAAAGIKPELYPTDRDAQALRSRGVTPLLGWPYFLVDEADDGFMRPNNVASGGQSSSETRYIRALVDSGRRLGLDGLVANAIFFEAESLNIYAFGQMCRFADLTPEQLIDRYAGFVADEKTRSVLGRVLRYIENHSNWQNSLPASYRLKGFDVPDVASASTALKLLTQVKPRARSAIPLPEPPALYLGRMKKRLEAIAAGNVGGVAPIRIGASMRESHAPGRRLGASPA
jgi:hypothetical protein